jgi:predicted nucleotidyltransferase
MKRSNKILELIKVTAQEILPDAEVMIFGSRARSTSHESSDFDILIVTRQKLTPKEKLPVRTQIRKALLRKGILSDILIQNSQEIEKNKNLPGHIIRRILKDAVIL